MTEAEDPKGASKLVIALLLSPVIIIGGCTALVMFPWTSVTPTASSTATSNVNKYVQTWPKDYKSTTCGEWLNKMTEAQRWAASADILTAARNKVSGGSGMPSDALVSKFERNISIGCEGSDAVTILEAAYYVYNYDSTYKP